jgi:hypothetical protein
MKINNVKSKEAAKLFKVTHAHIYKYLYNNVIPKPDIMLRIFIVTKGAVTPNDFYGATAEFLEQELLKQLNQGLEQNV